MNPRFELFIDSGFDNDRIIIDASIGVPVTVRGMASTDQLIVHGNGLDSGTYTQNGTAPVELDGNASYGGRSLSENHDIALRIQDSGTVEVDGLMPFSVVTPNGADVLTINTPAEQADFESLARVVGLAIIPLIAA